ncbi:MAG: ParB/RepB/Spo0J family partition protein [Acidobacteria bacterium]|nr:MAG: ParB/RepB/Spo0J family partition protein [Acidobacteriota bacterium]
MRADAHFVEQITSGRPVTVGRMIEIGRLRPNPTQPRKELQGIEELAESIRERGILEPILVRPAEDGMFEIIAGERRYRAARLAGLSLVPCVEVDVDDQGSLEISLIENLQRRDLSVFEEAEAIGRLVDEFGYTHEQVARRLGRSRTSITELLSLNRMPAAVKEACRRADITTKSTLMEIVRQESEQAMLELIEAIRRDGLTRDEVRERKRQGAPPRQEGARRPFVFRYEPPDQGFRISLRFEREQVEPQELLSALERVVEDLRRKLREQD